MNKNSTTFEKLISYAYNETDLSETVEVQKAIDTNREIATSYSEILDVLGMLDAVKEEPPKQLIDKILAHA